MSELNVKQVNIANLTNTAMSTLTCDGNGKVLMDGEKVVDLSEFGSSLAASGWQKLPSGLIIQWGITTIGVDESKLETMPITFPNAIIYGSINGPVGVNTAGYSYSGGNVNVGTSTTSQIRLNNDGPSSGTVNWLAIGH